MENKIIDLNSLSRYNENIKKYIDDKANTLYFEGTTYDWNNLTSTEQNSFLVSLVEPVVEVDENAENALQAILQDETSTETVSDISADDAEVILTRIIEGGNE